MHPYSNPPDNSSRFPKSGDGMPRVASSCSIYPNGLSSFMGHNVPSNNGIKLPADYPVTRPTDMERNRC